MNAAVKKKIINISSDVLAVFAAFLAFMCIFIKFKKTPALNFEKINLLAAKSVFSRGKHFFSIDLKKIFSSDGAHNNTYDWENNNDGAVKVQKNYSGSISNLSLPEFKGSDENEYHSPGEKTYKIIEGQYSSGGTKYENFYVKNVTEKNIDIALELSKSPEIQITGTKEPQVLIIHTHTSESYMSKDQGFFYENFYPRSLDNSKNVTRVGDTITQKLEENGINALHVTTHHDSPTYNGSYSRAAKTIKEVLEKHPTIQVVVDVHRDSLGTKESGKLKPTFKYKDKKAAQVMIVSGCDTDGSVEFPDWEKNLRLSLRLQQCCETLFPGFTRPMSFSKVKYNMHLTPGSMLVEVGSDVNTLEEAVYSGTMLGELLAKVLNNLKK